MDITFIVAMPPPAALAGVPIFSTAGSPPVFPPGSMTSSKLELPCSPGGAQPAHPQVPIAAPLYAEGIPAMTPGGMQVPHKLAKPHFMQRVYKHAGASQASPENLEGGIY